ncbi:MAG: AAA family ATPase [Gemmataceae bacterium]
MSTFALDLRPMADPDADAHPDDTGWVWDGVLARGDISLLTGVWKSGKTTLLAGLVHALGGSGEFLGRSCARGRVVVLSEESRAHWAERNRVIPAGDHARLVSRPFPGRPTASEWAELVAAVDGLREVGREHGPLDLFVVDPLSPFLPGWSDSDSGALLRFLEPLRLLAQGGTAVLVLHHPRRTAAAEGSLARGGGALLGYVDTILELHVVGRGGGGNRRRLTSRSRRPGAVEELVYEWVPGTPEFRAVATDEDAVFRENWEQVRAQLADRPAPATCPELLADWPSEAAPAPTVLYRWLRRAVSAGLAVRTGSGTKAQPFRFALPRAPELDELPPLSPLEPLRRPGR